MKLFTPYNIHQKDNWNLCRGKSNKRREVRIYVWINYLNSSSKALKKPLPQ